LSSSPISADPRDPGFMRPAAGCPAGCTWNEHPLHERALFWHGVELGYTRHRQQEGSPMIPHRTPDGRRRSTLLAVTGDLSTCPHPRLGSRSCTTSAPASQRPACSCSSSSSPVGRCAPAPHPDPHLERYPGPAPSPLRRLRPLGPEGQMVAGRALAALGRSSRRALGAERPAGPAARRHRRDAVK